MSSSLSPIAISLALNSCDPDPYQRRTCRPARDLEPTGRSITTLPWSRTLRGKREEKGGLADKALVLCSYAGCLLGNCATRLTRLVQICDTACCRQWPAALLRRVSSGLPVQYVAMWQLAHHSLVVENRKSMAGDPGPVGAPCRRSCNSLTSQT